MGERARAEVLFALSEMQLFFASLAASDELTIKAFRR